MQLCISTFTAWPSANKNHKQHNGTQNEWPHVTTRHVFNAPIPIPIHLTPWYDMTIRLLSSCCCWSCWCQWDFIAFASFPSTTRYGCVCFFHIILSSCLPSLPYEVHWILALCIGCIILHVRTYVIGSHHALYCIRWWWPSTSVSNTSNVKIYTITSRKWTWSQKGYCLAGPFSCCFVSGWSLKCKLSICI